MKSTLPTIISDFGTDALVAGIQRPRHSSVGAGPNGRDGRTLRQHNMAVCDQHFARRAADRCNRTVDLTAFILPQTATGSEDSCLW